MQAVGEGVGQRDQSKPTQDWTLREVDGAVHGDERLCWDETRAQDLLPAVGRILEIDSGEQISRAPECLTSW
jgi:hypothetical protein